MINSNLIIQGIECSIGGMYQSKVLKRVIEILYMIQPWRDAVTLPWLKGSNWESGVASATSEEVYAVHPPISFVAFTSTAVSAPGQFICTADMLLDSTAMHSPVSLPVSKIRSTSTRLIIGTSTMSCMS